MHYIFYLCQLRLLINRNYCWRVVLKNIMTRYYGRQTPWWLPLGIFTLIHINYSENVSRLSSPLIDYKFLEQFSLQKQLCLSSNSLQLHSSQFGPNKIWILLTWDTLNKNCIMIFSVFNAWALNYLGNEKNKRKSFTLFDFPPPNTATGNILVNFLYTSYCGFFKLNLSYMC